MDNGLFDYLRMTSKNFEDAYCRAKEYIRENINPYCDHLELSEKTNCNICFPLTDDNLYVLGLDTKSLTIWIFFDSYLADAN